MRTPAPPLLRRILTAAALAASCAVAQAAAPDHVYPMGSQQGYASFGAGPTLRVNCVNYPLGPGLRVQTPEHRVVLLGQLPGVHGPAVFQRDAMGKVFQVWMLGPGQSAGTVPSAPNRCLFQKY